MVIIMIIIIIFIYKEDNLLSMIATLPYGPPVNTDIDYYQTFFGIFHFWKCCNFSYAIFVRRGGGVAQWLGRRISDQGVPGSNPCRCTFRCGLEQVTFTLLSTG